MKVKIYPVNGDATMKEFSGNTLGELVTFCGKELHAVPGDIVLIWVNNRQIGPDDSVTPKDDDEIVFVQHHIHQKSWLDGLWTMR